MVWFIRRERFIVAAISLHHKIMCRTSSRFAMDAGHREGSYKKNRMFYLSASLKMDCQEL